MRLRSVCLPFHLVVWSSYFTALCAVAPTTHHGHQFYLTIVENRQNLCVGSPFIISRSLSVPRKPAAIVQKRPDDVLCE
ncbi:hypothetical protein BJX65DRAFT_89569 [Aspergillus insuetus]